MEGGVAGAVDRSWSLGKKFEFLAFVFGTVEGLAGLHGGLGHDGIHMSRLADRMEQKRIISRMRAGDKGVLAFCIKLSRDIDNLENVGSMRKRRIPSAKIHRTHDRLVMSLVRERLEDFATGRHCKLGDVPVECDRDCKSFLMNNDLSRADPGIVHELADIIAWANQRGMDIPWVVELDLSGRAYNCVLGQLR